MVKCVIFSWRNSKTVINYINKEKTNFGVFIAHGINEIRNSFKTKQWFYVPTNQNVADNLTRYKGFDNLTNRSRWCVGPDFLHKEVASESLSTNCIINNKQDHTVLPNNITNKHLKNKETKVTSSTCKQKSNLASKINWERYSSFFTLANHPEWIIKLKVNWIKRKRGALIRESFSFLTAIECNKIQSTVIMNVSTQQFKNSYSTPNFPQWFDKSRR